MPFSVAGDFISQRRYKAGVYAIPYEGEEVKLHWANADQYYVKTTEDFQDYRFKLGDGRHVHFRLVAADTERDNNKAENGRDRRFGLRQEHPVAEVDGDLEIYFEYRPSANKQAEISAQSIGAVLKEPTAKAWRDALCQPSGKDKTLFEKHLHAYTSKNTFDYFIHKDLGGFLRRELDFFLKNEVAHLDDLDRADAPQAEQYLGRLRAIRRIGNKIIEFLAQLEEFQKRLYLKKKLVIRTDYSITIDRVPESLYAGIISNDLQWSEWNRLFAISEIKSKSDRALMLKSQPSLVLDTKNFDQDFIHRLLNEIDDLEARQDGLLINSENSQALSLITKRYSGSIPTIYLDPPYNTNASEILYKNDYKHSTWLAFMSSRLASAAKLSSDDGIICVTIDDDELHGLWYVLEQQFGRDRHLGTALIRNNPQGRSTVKGFAVNHEFGLFFASGGTTSGVGRLERSGAQINRYNHRDENGKRFLWENLRKTGTDSNRNDRPRQFYPLYFDGEKLRVPAMSWNLGTKDWDINDPPTDNEQIFWPINDAGVEKVWKWGYDRIELYPEHVKVATGEGGKLQVFRRNYLNTKGTLPGTWWDKPRYAAGEYGTNVLTDLFGMGHRFPFPKSIHAVEDSIRVSNEESSGTVLDFFAGSGSTGHAVINLNRQGADYKYVLVEMGDYFESILKPRISKVVYSMKWNDGRPVNQEGSSHFFKSLRLESYEDSLSNIDLHEPTAPQQAMLNVSDSLREDYILRYILDAESADSPTKLNIEQFADPFNYQIRTVQGGETTLTKVDLPETFNWLLGLTVEKIRFIDDIQTLEGTDPLGKRTLVIWRNLTNERHGNEQLEDFFKDQGYLDRPVESALDHIYVNGDCTLSSLKSIEQTWQVHLTEEAFKRLMFDTAEGSR